MGSPAGGMAASIACTLFETAKLNRVDPQAWLGDVLNRIPEQPNCRVAAVELHCRYRSVRNFLKPQGRVHDTLTQLHMPYATIESIGLSGCRQIPSHRT